MDRVTSSNKKELISESSQPTNSIRSQFQTTITRHRFKKAVPTAIGAHNPPDPEQGERMVATMVEKPTYDRPGSPILQARKFAFGSRNSCSLGLEIHPKKTGSKKKTKRRTPPFCKGPL